MRNRYSRAEEETPNKGDAKPKYIGKLLEAKKKREFEALLRDERKQEKQRKAEGEEFKGKDVFVTTAYRKRLEETVKFRKELEESDRIDEMTGVRGQKMWRENFGKKLLEDRIKDRYGDIETEDDRDRSEDRRGSTRSREDRSNDRHGSTRSREDRSEDRRGSTRSREDRSNDRRGSTRSREDRSKDRYSDVKTGYDRDRSKDRYGSTKSRDDRDQAPDTKRIKLGEESSSRREQGYKEAERDERRKRMKVVRQILKQRNSTEDIEAARQRYFERRQAGLIIPPP